MLYWIASASRIYTTLSRQEFLKSVILRRTGRQWNDRFWAESRPSAVINRTTAIAA